MNHWLEGKTHLDPEDIFSDDEYGLLNAAKFAMLVFINKSANSSNSTVNGTSENESGLFSSELEGNNVSENEISCYCIVRTTRCPRVESSIRKIP